MCSLLCYQSPTKGLRIESSYKIGKWIYYYENGQIEAAGTYKTIIAEARIAIGKQFYKSSVTTDNWVFLNSDGKKSDDKQKIITEVEHNSNCF